MSKFKVGDIIVGKKSSNVYCHTAKKNGFVGEVTYTRATEIEVKTLKSKTGFTGDCFWVDPEHFKLKKDDSKTIVKVSPPYVYALKDGKVGISKCRDSDEFDEEFGKKLAEAKLNGDKKEEESLIKEKYPPKRVLFDSRGVELKAGDEVVAFGVNSNYFIKKNVREDYIGYRGRVKMWVEGMEMNCNDETGEIKGWEVYKLAKK